VCPIQVSGVRCQVSVEGINCDYESMLIRLEQELLYFWSGFGRLFLQKSIDKCTITGARRSLSASWRLEERFASGWRQEPRGQRSEVRGRRTVFKISNF